jgi:pimeloyl-ACP methyl ester carboxylesterase
MELRDGRVLAYTDCGVSSDPAVMYFHGAPTSRLDLVRFEDAFESLGVRVVSPDRPGYGGSSPQPGRIRGDWPADVAELADHLGLDRFSVIGYSSGGPYAVACAALLPDRVSAAGVVAGVTDMGWLGAWDGYLEAESTVMRLADEAAATDWYVEHYGADGAGFFDEAGDLAPADAALFEDEEAAAGFFATVTEALRQGVAGYAQDVTVQGRGWAFDPTDISVPITVLHGEADTFVSITHGRHTAELIPTATLSTFADHGHLSIMSEIPQLAAKLTPAMS